MESSELIALFLGNSLEAVAETAKEPGYVASLANQFGVRWPMVIAQSINFCIVAVLLYFFLFRPILTILDKRKGEIQKGLDYADQMKAKLAEAEAHREQVMKDTALAAQRLVNEAREQASALMDDQTKDALSKAEAIISHGRETIQLERHKMIDEARKKLTGLVVAAAARVLERDLHPDERKKFTESAMDRLYEEESPS